MSTATPLARGALLLFTLGICSCADQQQGAPATADAGGDAATDAAIGPADLAPRPDLAPDLQLLRGTWGQGGQTGHTTQTLAHDGEPRLFAVRVPSSYREDVPAALLLHFHGWRPPPAEVSEELRYVWGETADQQGFIAVAPEGLACPALNPQDPYACFRESRDGPFITALIEHLGGLYNLDLDRVYLSGHSGGAFFVQSHGLSHGEIYAAAATFEGGCIGISDEYENSCAVYRGLSATASRKAPFYVVHHGSDQVVPAQYSADLLALLQEGGHPTCALDQFEPRGQNGHSINVQVVPQVWQWISGFTLAGP